MGRQTGRQARRGVASVAASQQRSRAPGHTSCAPELFKPPASAFPSPFLFFLTLNLPHPSCRSQVGHNFPPSHLHWQPLLHFRRARSGCRPACCSPHRRAQWKWRSTTSRTGTSLCDGSRKVSLQFFTCRLQVRLLGSYCLLACAEGRLPCARTRPIPGKRRQQASSSKTLGTDNRRW